MARVARLGETLSAASTGLVLFDALNGYLHPSDPQKQRFLEEHRILQNLVALKEGARAVGMTTFFPMGKHARDGSDSVERLTDTDMDLRPWPAGGGAIRPRLHRENAESDVVAELGPDEGDVLIAKNRWNAFFGTNLDLQLRVRGIGTIVLAGGSTDVGIASTMFAARDLDYGIVVVSDACYSTRGDNDHFFQTRVFPRMGRVRTVAQTIGLMTR